MKVVTKQESKELNEWISSFVDADSGYNAHDSGKQIPYIGWYWRDVDFTEPFSLGWCVSAGTVIQGLGVLETASDFVGFMENNKWSYAEWRIKEDVYGIIVGKLRNIKSKEKLSLDLLQDLDQFLQTLKMRFRECQHCNNNRDMIQSKYGDSMDNLCKSCRKFVEKCRGLFKNLYAHNYTRESINELTEQHPAKSNTLDLIWKNKNYWFKQQEETNH